MSKTLWILCGIPGSGKSTWAESYIKEFNTTYNNYIRVSRDEIRFELLDDNDDYFKHENLVWDIFIRHIRAGIVQYDNVIADATHLDERSRNKLIKELNLHDSVKINCVFFDVPVEVCLERNNKRAGWARVPASVIRRMAVQLVKPTFNERYRYDKIYIVNADGQHCKTETQNGITWALPSTEVACEDCAEAECAGRFSVMRNGGCKYVNIPNK